MSPLHISEKIIIRSTTSENMNPYSTSVELKKHHVKLRKFDKLKRNV